MTKYKIIYIGIGGRKDYAIIDAYTPFDAREEFENTYWAYHEIISIEPIN